MNTWVNFGSASPSKVGHFSIGLNIPLSEDVETYFQREVLPHAPDAWIDPDKTKVGYEIPFNRHFYVFEPPRPLEEIDADLKRSTDRIKAMIEGLTA